MLVPIGRTERHLEPAAIRVASCDFYFEVSARDSLVNTLEISNYIDTTGFILSAESGQLSLSQFVQFGDFTKYFFFFFLAFCLHLCMLTFVNKKKLSSVDYFRISRVCKKLSTLQQWKLLPIQAEA